MEAPPPTLNPENRIKLMFETTLGYRVNDIIYQIFYDLIIYIINVMVFLGISSSRVLVSGQSNYLKIKCIN